MPWRHPNSLNLSLNVVWVMRTLQASFQICECHQMRIWVGDSGVSVGYWLMWIWLAPGEPWEAVQTRHDESLKKQQTQREDHMFGKDLDDRICGSWQPITEGKKLCVTPESLARVMEFLWPGKDRRESRFRRTRGWAQWGRCTACNSYGEIQERGF